MTTIYFRCKECGYPHKFIIHRDRKQASKDLKDGAMQHTANIPEGLWGQLNHWRKGLSFWKSQNGQQEPEDNRPFVELLTRQMDGNVKRDKIMNLTDEEFYRIAYAVDRNDGKFSIASLARYGNMSRYRAEEIAQTLTDHQLRFVDKKNQSHLPPRLIWHLQQELESMSSEGQSW